MRELEILIDEDVESLSNNAGCMLIRFVRSVCNEKTTVTVMRPTILSHLRKFDRICAVYCKCGTIRNKELVVSTGEDWGVVRRGVVFIECRVAFLLPRHRASGEPLRFAVKLASHWTRIDRG